MSEGVTVILPCLNEEASVGEAVTRALAGIAATGLPGEVLVVDNESTDRSAANAVERGARVVTERHRGYGAALRCGFREAAYDYMVMADADLTYDFAEIPNFIAPLRSGQAQLVMGNRMRNIRPGAMPWHHKYIGNPVLSLALRLMFHSHAVKDAHCGMRAITRAAYDQLRCVTTGMEFASEMVIRAIRCDLRIAERDITYHPRKGYSKLRSFRDGWRHLRFMALHSPAFMLLFPGLFFWLVSLLLLVRFAFGSLIFHTRVFDIHSMIVGGILNAVSMQLILVGLLAKAYAHLSGLHDDPLIAWLYRRLTFERAIFYVTPFILMGLVATLWVIGKWIFAGFGALNEARLLFFGSICLINGVQLGTSAYLFSIMALPRHIDQMAPQHEDTAIRDL